MVGCGTGTRAGTAKSRAADWPGKPSFTPVVLALSLIAIVDGGTAREPVPFPRDTASASLLRAVRDLCWNLNLSMAANRTANRARASRVVQDNKHASSPWIRRRAVSGKGTAAWIEWLKSLAFGPGHRHTAAGQTPQPPFAALRIATVERLRGCSSQTMS